MNKDLWINLAGSALVACVTVLRDAASRTEGKDRILLDRTADYAEAILDQRPTPGA